MSHLSPTISTIFFSFSPLPKSSRAHRIKENADVHDFEISDEDIARLDALDKGDDGALEWNPIHVD